MGALKKGDHVVTIGRLHGVIDEINQADKTVTLDCDGIYLVFDLRAISSVTSQAPAAVTAPVAASEAAAKEAPAADASAAAEPASEAAASDAPADDADDSEATK